MKADAGRLRQAVAAPSSAIRLYLLHGSDESAAQVAAQQLGRALGPDAERIDLDGAALRKDPGRLAAEAASPSLFGTARYVRVTAVGEESLEALTALLAAPHADAPVVALAPGVRTSARIVKLAIDSPLALACAFYPPTAAEAERLATGLARAQGMTPEPGVARRLIEASGGDQALVAQEIDKLALFLDAAPERPQALGAAALDALGADHGDTSLPDLVAALVEGDAPLLGAMLEQARADGGSAVVWLRAAMRRLLTLADMRGEIDAGQAPGDVMKKHRVFFREEAATLAGLRRWSPAMLARGVHRLRAAERAVMGGSAAGVVIAEAAMLTIARGIAERR